MHVAGVESGRRAGSAGQVCRSQNMKGVLNHTEEFACESNGNGELIQGFKEESFVHVFLKVTSLATVWRVDCSGQGRQEQRRETS